MHVKLFIYMMFCPSLVLLLPNILLAENSVKYQSAINEVVLFFNAAQINRTTTVQVTKGNNVFVFEQLSPQINTSTVLLNASKAVLFTKINFEDYMVDSSEGLSAENLQNSDSLNAIYKSISALQIKVRKLQNEQTIIKSEMSYITTIRLKQPSVSKDYSKTELAELLPFYKTTYIDLTNRLIETELEVTQLNAQKKALELKMPRAANTKPKQYVKYKRLILHIDADIAQSVTLNFTYMVNQAGWNPVYDIQSEYVTDPILLTTRASLYQHTGVDWNNIKLMLSSSEPFQNKGIPKLEPKYINFYEKKVSKLMLKPAATRWEKATGDVNCLSANPEDCMVMSLVDVPAEYKTQAITQTDININSQLKEKISLASGLKSYNQLLKKQKVDVQYIYQGISSTSQYAYLTANISNWERLNLMEGVANIYSNNTYTGTIEINPKKIEAIFELGLGIDKQIKIEKQKLGTTSKKSFFEGTKTEYFSYTTTVQNNKPVAINVLLKEQIPLSNTGDISVKLEEANDAAYDENIGLLEWPLELEQGETKTVSYSYAVTYPKNTYLGY